MKKILDWIINKRLLDGYIGILGIVCHYRILASYHITVSVISLNLRFWKQQVFRLAIDYHSFSRFYPKYTFCLQVFGKGFNTAKKAAKQTKDSVDKYMKIHDAEKEEEKRLIEAAKEAGL